MSDITKRISLIHSMAISLLLHMFVFFSISFLLLLQPAPPKEIKNLRLEVRLAQPYLPKVQPIPKKKLLTSTTNDYFKVTEVPVQTPPVIAPSPPAPAIEPAPPATDQITGIALPGSIPTPFPVQGRSNNSLFQARSAQQGAARAYYQQAMEAQSRQRSEQQAQLIMLQLHQTLAKLLDTEPVLTGKCVLAEADKGLENSLQCDSAALQDLLTKDQQNIVNMRHILRGMGRIFSGFSVAAHNSRPVVTLHNDSLPASFDKRTNP